MATIASTVEYPILLGVGFIIHAGNPTSEFIKITQLSWRVNGTSLTIYRNWIEVMFGEKLWKKQWDKVRKAARGEYRRDTEGLIIVSDFPILTVEVPVPALLSAELLAFSEKFNLAPGEVLTACAETVFRNIRKNRRVFKI